MERSPRSAGVRPQRASMGQYHTLRSFVISLAIAIVITKSPASGFTIPRSQKVLDSAPDLDTGESTQLEVKYDLKATHDNKTININKTKVDSDSSVIAINDPKNVDMKNKSYEKVSATTLLVNETANVQPQIISNRKFETSDTPNITSTEKGNYYYTTSLPSTSQTTTREPEKDTEHLIISTSPAPLSVESQISPYKDNVNGTVEDNAIERKLNDTNNSSKSEFQNTFELKRAPDTHNYSTGVSSTEKQYTNNDTIILNDTYSFTNKSDKTNDSATASSYTARKDVARSIFNRDVKNATDFVQLTINGTDKNISSTDVSLDNPTTMLYEPNVTNITTEEPVTNATTETFSTETTITTEMYPRTLPPWKKYTTIDRKRTSTEDTTAPGKDMAEAETAQTRISLEKILNNTPIPSLEKLRNDLINAQEASTKKPDTTNGFDINVSSAPEVVTSFTPTMAAGIDNTTSKLEIVSKRAGFKDNRETTTRKPEEATTSEFPLKVSVNDTEMFSSMYETEASEAEVTENKNETVYESQSQLAEDAIKEELLKEETLNDNEENAMRHDERIILPRVKPLKSKSTEEPVTTHEVVTEDMLSVKPIGHDKKKNTILYAVSQNYKPLKKIDVQPSKQFVRDPDDNSWRNESISSLGIVFKPKNASKSFTQVLRNKTESELANMTDKDNKGDLPDLRVRLEKIAEVRKSKKKNKFGDTVYGDYEESAENANPSKEGVTSPMSPAVESVLSFTPPPSKATSDFDLTVNAISRERLNIFKDEGTTPLTTNKPKKFYNVAEYYDATDEYDADYINLHKIDLKKFTQPLKPKESAITQPPYELNTKPMKEYQPERKATLQYFPPTQKVAQKVNLNDYDTDFNRKVNLYTFKEHTSSKPAASYGTVSPLPTDKYEPVNKVTVKPNYTPMYKTDHLNKNLYLTNQPRVSEPPSGFVPNDGNFNRASYVIKHYRDFINEAAKEGEDDRSGEYPYTESPLRGVTINELAKMNPPRDSNQGEEEYDYDVKYRKEVMDRFVDNFNQNSDRFKVDFPILYNSSVVHRQPENGKVASSTAFLKRLYEVGHPRPSNFLSNRRPCDPHCDNMTVELSPAYELHYYVPEQEEKEEIEPRPITVPYRYRL